MISQFSRSQRGVFAVRIAGIAVTIVFLAFIAFALFLHGLAYLNARFVREPRRHSRQACPGGHHWHAGADLAVDAVAGDGIGDACVRQGIAISVSVAIVQAKRGGPGLRLCQMRE